MSFLSSLVHGRNMFYTALTVSLVLLAAGAEAESEEIEIKTPQGTVRVKQSQVEPTPQKITVIQGDKLKQLAALSHDARFLKNYRPDAKEPTLHDYDEAFNGWRRDKSDKYSADDVVLIVGGYLGNRCVADFDMQWVRVEDEYGTDFAVRAKTSDVMIFPFSSVQKCIKNPSPGFVHGVYHAVKSLLEANKAAPREP